MVNNTFKYVSIVTFNFSIKYKYLNEPKYKIKF